MMRFIFAGVLALAVPAAAHAQAVMQSLKGDVQVGGVPVHQGRRVLPYSAITTGAASQASIRFDDGMQIVLGENSVLRFHDYRYTQTGSGGDRAVFELLRGSARVVTGRIAMHNPKEFFFRTPQTELTVERGGADFTVALVNPAYVTVHLGTVMSTNGSGPAALNAGSTSVVASNAAAPAAIAASALPPSASAAMSSLAVASVTGPAGGGAAGAGAALGGAAQTTTQWAILGIVAAGVIAAVAANQDDSPSVTTPPSH